MQKLDVVGGDKLEELQRQTMAVEEHWSNPGRDYLHMEYLVARDYFPARGGLAHCWTAWGEITVDPRHHCP